MTFRQTARGQSEVLGAVLLVGLVVVGTTAIVSIGAGMLDESRDRVTVERVEDAMTSLDSQAAKVALGDAPVQTVDLGGTGDGHYVVDEDAGWLRVVHHNYTGDSDETIYNATLGAFVYRNGETSVAYQGGGVWRGDGDGSVLVSPPEFHYRDETLTLPLIAARGDGAVSGSTRAVVSRGTGIERIFPNEATTYSGVTRPYLNPIQDGRVNVTVRSEYYEAWADFFRTRTHGSVSIDRANETVTLELTAGGTEGGFQMPREGNAIEVRGLTPHSIENFTITLAPDDTDAANFDNLQWAMYVTEGKYELELNLRKSGEIAGAPDCADEVFAVTLYFSDRNGNRYHGWRNETALISGCTDRDGDGVADETRLHVNFTGTTPLRMTDLDRRHLTHFNPNGDTRPARYTFDEHEGAVPWEPTAFSDGGDDDTSIANVTNHYLSRLGEDFDLVVDDKNSDTVDESASYGRLVYDAEGTVTYMHITWNKIRIRATT